MRTNEDHLHTHTHTQSLLPGLVEALVGVVLEEGPGDAVVGGEVQQDPLPRLVRGRTRAQGAATAQPQGELQVPEEREREGSEEERETGI